MITIMISNCGREIAHREVGLRILQTPRRGVKLDGSWIISAGSRVWKNEPSVPLATRVFSFRGVYPVTAETRYYKGRFLIADTSTRFDWS